MATAAILGLWEHVVATYDPYAIKFVGLAVTNIIFWWVPCIVFVSLDYVAPSFSARHKMQPADKQPTIVEILHCAIGALCNHLLALVEYVGLSCIFSTNDYPSGVGIRAEIPSLSEFLTEFLLCFILREIMFYYGHRIFHWRPLYKRYHKIHHEFTAPVAFSSQYAHPVEYLTSDSLPVMLPPMLLRVHVVSTWAFTAGVLISSAVIHSGYDFFYKAARMHDRHHEGANAYFGAFGALGLLDWLHGTVEKDRQSGKKSE
jgi:methylsterol monooxygenase